MKGDRTYNVTRADSMHFAFVQLQADHALLMRPIPARTRAASLSCRRAIAPPKRLPLSSARPIVSFGALAVIFYFAHFSDRTLLFIRTRDFDRGGGYIQRVVSFLDQCLHH